MRKVPIKFLRKTNLRWIGIPILVMGVFAGYMIGEDKSALLRYGVPSAFLIWGLFWLKKPSYHHLWIQDGELRWKSVEGKNTVQGAVEISRVRAVELVKKGPSGKNGMQWNEVSIVSEKGKSVLPRAINFGGTGNPKIKDVLGELRKINPSISYEEKDQIKYR